MSNVNKKEILELKRRFKKDDCTFSRLCGCYVDGERNKVTTFGETFLNLEEEELHKYLEIAKKTLSGTLGNNILHLEYPLEEEGAGGKQQFLMGLKASGLKNDELVDAFFDLIIENYYYPGNYLILLFMDAYDVMTKTTDNNKLDESEEVYEYMLCAICPVALSKPGLGYREDENRIGSRIRDWVVGVPDTGFLFPAFVDRSSDIHSLLFYTKNPKAPHNELVENGLGLTSKFTATEEKLTFQGIVKHVIGEEDEEAKGLFMEIQSNINDLIPIPEEDKEPEPVPMTASTMSSVLSDSGVSKENIEIIEKKYNDIFGQAVPEAGHLVDTKILEANEKRRERLQLVEQVENLKQQLDETRAVSIEADEDDVPVTKTYDVILRVKPEKVSQIHSEIINGQKCLVIPMEEDEHAAVNGVNTTV